MSLALFAGKVPSSFIVGVYVECLSTAKDSIHPPDQTSSQEVMFVIYILLGVFTLKRLTR